MTASSAIKAGDRPRRLDGAATAPAGRGRLLIAMMALVLSLVIMALRPAPARAETVVSVINLPAVVIDNQCDGEPVALSGDLLMVVTTARAPTAAPSCGRSLSPTGCKGRAW